MTRHACERCRTRKISTSAVDVTMVYGNRRVRRGAEIYILGWREVDHWLDQGVDLTPFEGTCVVCSHGQQVITVYRRRRGPSLRQRALRRAA
mgnify:CR=1 FL=1|jgi:hypothetical protein